MFDIPMNSSGAMGTDSLMNLMGGSAPSPTQSAPTQQPQGGNYGGNVGMNMQAQPQGGNVGMNMQAQPQGGNVDMNMQAQPQMNTPIQPKQRPQGNGVVLKKGQKVPLGAGLTSVKVGLGWDITNQNCDLDASAFLLGADGRVIGDDWFVFYGQTVSPDGSVSHSGDSQGEGFGDDEVITINLSAMNQNVKKIVFVVTINEALERGFNFSMVANAYVRVVNNSDGSEIIRFNLSDYYSNVTSMMVGEIYNHNGQWKFNAIGDGVAKDLAGLCAMYGVNVVG